MICKNCAEEVSPVTYMGVTGIMRSCPKCHMALGPPELHSDPGAPPLPKPVPHPAEHVPNVVHRKKEMKKAEQGPLNILRSAKKRLKEIRAEIRKIEKLKAEEAQLSRIIDAGEKHFATVTKLRTTA